MEYKKKRMINTFKGKKLQEKLIMEKVMFYMRQNNHRALDLISEALMEAIK